MTLLADLTVRSSVLVLLGILLSACLRHRSAALRHAVLATALVAAAVVVPLSLVGPSWAISWPAFEGGRESAVTPARVTAIEAAGEGRTAPRADPLPFGLVVWAAGFLASLAMLLVGLGHLVRVTRRARRAQDRRWTRIGQDVAFTFGLARPIAILHTDAPALLATWGVFRPCVLLPAHADEWTDDRIHVVLCHELAHVRRRDWIVQIGAELLRTIYWFNPLLWIACTRLRRESEQACDDEVLRAGVPAREYASHLLELAKQCRRPGRAWVSAMPMARPSTLERRIAAMLNPHLNRRALSGRAFAVTAAFAMLVMLPIGAVRAAQNAPLTLAGTVYDTTGAVLPAVQLTLHDAQQQQLQAATDRAGRFAFPSVAPGQYVLEARIAGFRPLRQDVELRSARDWDRAITLQVGELKEKITVQADRVAGPTGPSQAQLPATVTIGGNLRVPRKLHDVKPVYPVSMREAGREGVVPMEAVIGTDGLVTSVRVLSAHIHPDFAIAAVDAVRQWRFDPTLLNGKPVDVRMSVSVEFRLAD